MSHLHKDNADLTKERLLTEAETLFAKKGFEGVSVREITSKAQCNLAAVNYHFGNKKNLYLEVFRCRWAPRAKRLQGHFRKSLPSKKPSVSAIIQSLANAFLAGPMSDEERHRHLQLMSRELSQPTEAFELVANEIMRPFFGELSNMLRSELTQKVEKDQLILHVLSIFSMVLYFNFAREAVSRITGRQYDDDFKARLVRQITEFSLKGLEGGLH